MTAPDPPRSADQDDDRSATDWFGYPVRKDVDLRPVAPVPCPRCGTPFDSGSALRAHLVEAHGERAGRTTSPSDRGPRFRRWVESLAYLPFWFVVPLNLGVTGVLAAAWWHDLAAIPADDPAGFLKTWIVVVSLLPVTCYLAARVATIRRD